jgi:uncharacterized repeat protein (TIGR01451 family)
MKGVRLKALGVALLGALALMFAGCGGSPAPTKGSLTVNVSPANADVQVTGPGGFSQSFTGGKTLTDLDPGDYTVQASKAGYFTASATHKVEAGKITTAVLSLLPVPASGPTEGKVAVLVVNGNGSPIPGATVFDGTTTVTTDAQGRADFTYTAAGTYAISVNAAGYLGAAQLASVELGKTVALTFKLQPVPPSGPTEGKVAVLVVNGNGSPIPGATVFDGTTTVTTDAQGRADFTYTAAGTYAISVNAAGYLGAAQLASVELGKTVALTFKLQPVPPSGPTEGKVAVLVVNGNGSPIPGATVFDGTTTVTTDAQGRADFTYTAAGTYAIIVNASGYQGDAKLASVKLGETVALTFKLQPQPDPAPTTGTLVVHVYGADTGQTLFGPDVVVVSNPTLTFSPSGGLFTATAAPGRYAVTASAPGYLSGSRAANVEAGKTTVLNIGLQSQRNAPSGPVGNVEIVSVKDQWGADLPVERERNEAKDVNLYASQTEEPVCVTVRVTRGGQPVQNARVRVTAVGYGETAVALYKGCETQNVSELDFVMTDADGIAKFSFQGLGEFSVLPELVKFLISASEEGSGWTARSKEFKVFFFNITHLIYRDEDGNTRRADRRVGGFLGSFENAFDFDNPANNAHTFRVYVNQKQPQRDLSSSSDLPSGTQVRYEIVSGADKVEFASPCPPSTCTVPYGTNVTIRPKSGVGPGDLPFSATVKATLLLPVTYGTTYSFALKDATFTKTWVGTNLRIQKSGPRILTWTGTDLFPEDVTLPARDAEVGKTYTYTITVTNTGSVTANNVVINENLPAELGFVSASPGGTYDPVLHQVTWNQTGLPALASIPPGGIVSVTVTVYARHKPGMSWNDKDGDTETDDDNRFGEPGYYHPSRPPAYGLDTPYPDPYPVLNRAEVRGSNTPFRAVDYELWVVRPFMRVEKRALVSEVYVGDAIPYTITITNQDRAEAPYNDPGYQYLKATYPGEYAQEMTLYNVTLRDLFAEGLDYVNSSPLGTLDDNGKTVTWELGNLAVGQATQVRLFLRGALAREWENCARGYASNLNQFPYDPDPPYYPRWVVQPTQLEPASDDVIDPRPDTAYELELENPDSVGNFLQSCVTVQVLPRAAEYILSITTLGEYTDPADGPGTNTDPVPSGTPYWYLFILRGDGPGSQTNVTLTVNFPVPNITYNGAVQVAISTDNGATWTTVPSASYLVNWAPPTLTIQYLPSLPPGALLRFSVRAVGTATGSVSAFGSSTQVASTATVTENTTIRP